MQSWFQLVLHPAWHFAWCSLHISLISQVTVYSLDILLSQFGTSPLVLITASCTVSRTSIYSSLGTLSIRSNPLNLFVASTVWSSGIWYRSYLNDLVFFPTFFNLSMNFAIRSSWSEPQSVPGLVFADCIMLLHFGCKEDNQSDFCTDHLVMSMCRVISCVVEEGVCYDQCVLLSKLC